MRAHEILEAGRLTDPSVDYEDLGDRVVAQLKSYESATYTRLANRVEEISRLEAEIKAAKAEVKSMTRQHVADLFAAEDAVKTRVVDTVSFIMTLSKDPKPTETVQYAKVVEALTEHLTPELIKVLEQLKKQFKTVTQKEPSLRITRKEDLAEAIISKLGEYLRRFLAWVTSWGQRYDAKLDALRRMVR